jgi:hypothetical protein
MTFHAIRQRPRRMLAVAQDGEQSAGGLRSDAYGEPAYIGKRVILLTVADALLSTSNRTAIPGVSPSSRVLASPSRRQTYDS